MNKTKIKVETYKVYGKWYVDIQTEKEMYFAYIWRAGYGDKKMMFGCGKDQQSYEDFLDLVEENFEDYRSDYIDDEIAEENVLEEELRFCTRAVLPNVEKDAETGRGRIKRLR